MPRQHCESVTAGSRKITMADHPQVLRDGELVDLAFRQIGQYDRRVHVDDLGPGDVIRTDDGAVHPYNPVYAHGRKGGKNADDPILTAQEAHALAQYQVGPLAMTRYASQYSALLEAFDGQIPVREATSLAEMTHERWRRLSEQADGPFRVAMHATGAGFIDIGATPYNELPWDVRHARVATALGALAAAHHYREDPNRAAALERTASLIHEHWLTDHRDSALPHQTPAYEDLRLSEQDKDRAVADLAIHILDQVHPRPAQPTAPVDPKLVALMSADPAEPAAPWVPQPAPRDWSRFAERLGPTTPTPPAEPQPTYNADRFSGGPGWRSFDERLGTPAPTSAPAEPQPTFNADRFSGGPGWRSFDERLGAAPAPSVASTRDAQTLLQERLGPRSTSAPAAVTPSPEVPAQLTREQQGNQLSNRARHWRGGTSVFDVDPSGTPDRDWYFEAHGRRYQSDSIEDLKAFAAQEAGGARVLRTILPV